MVNYKELAKSLDNDALSEQIKHTRFMIREYQKLVEESVNQRNTDTFERSIDELDARLTAYMIENWNRKYPA